MSVNWQPIEIPFGGGINTKTDYKRLQPPQVQDLQNLVFTEYPGYKLRNGYTELTAIASSSPAGRGVLVAYDNSLCLISLWGVKPYIPQSDQFVSVQGWYTVPQVSERENISSTYDQSLGATATLSGTRVTAWLEGAISTTNLYYNIEDVNTGTSSSGVVLVGASTAANKPRVTAASTYIFISYWDAAATALEYIRVTPATGAVTSGTWVTDVHSAGVYDVIKNPTSDGLLVVYRRNNGGTSNLSGFTVGSTGTAGTTRTINSTAGERDVTSVSLTANQLYAFIFASASAAPIVYVERTDLTLQNRAQQDTAAHTAINTAITCVESSSTAYTGTYMYWSVTNAEPYLNTVRYVSGQVGLAGYDTLQRFSLASSAFMVDERWPHVLVSHDSSCVTTPTRLAGRSGLQRTVCLFSSLDASLVARFSPGECVSYNSTGFLPNVRQTATHKFDVCYAVNGRLSTNDQITNTDNFEQKRIRTASLDFTSLDKRFFACQAGNTLYYNGGNSLFEFDGRAVIHNNFWFFPENVNATSANGTGSMASSTTYNYRVYFEYTNSRGEKRRSTTSEVITITLGAADDTVTLTIPSSLTNINNSSYPQVSIVVYRSEGNADVAGGAPFYRVSSPDPLNATTNNDYIVASYGTSTFQFIDGMTDAELITNELDYLNTGELDNIAAPVGSVLGQAKGRLWVAGGVDNTRVFYSKLRFSGETVSFNEANQISVPDDGDPSPVVAIVPLNYAVVFFRSDSIYVVTGDGPDNLGRGVFNQPQKVTSDVGCSEPRSVIAYDGGILFKSDKGIYRLGQNYEVQYIGAPVESYNTQDVTAATLCSDLNQIRFLTSSGRMLVFDYLVNQWTTFTGWTGVSAVNWRNGDVYTWLTSAEVVNTEDQTVFTDNGTEYRGVFRTAPLTLRGLGGYFKMKRVIFLGEYYTAHTLDVVVNYDFGSDQSADSWSSASADHTNPYEVVYNLPRQKFSSVEFQVTVNPTSAGRGAEIDALSAEVAFHPGLNRQPSANKFGS